MGPQFTVSSEGLEKPEIEPTTPCLQGKWLNHYTREASQGLIHRETLMAFIAQACCFTSSADLIFFFQEI